MEEMFDLFGLKNDYKINSKKKIRLIELFAGIGAQAKALENLGVNFEHYKICEFDKYAVASYNGVHQTNFTTSDITKIHAEDLDVRDTDKYEYIMTYSFPCLTDNSLIYTKEKGYVEFKTLKVGDEVLTKSNTYHKISKIFDNGIHQTCYLDGMGFENIHCTLNHKFYVREMYRKGHKAIRTFKEPVFKEVKDLTRKDYFGIPVNQVEEFFYTDKLWFWYLIGFYLGDGWLYKSKSEIYLTVNETKLNWLLEKVLPHVKYKIYKEKTYYKITINEKDIYSFIENYIGTGSGTKVISPKIINLPKKELMAFYEGYLNSDGSIVKGKHQFSSINRNIIYSISMIINKLYLRPTCIYKIKVSPAKKIEGRIVNQKDYYQLRFNPKTNTQDKAFYEDGYIWYPFNKYILDKEEHVYNMEVEDDHSYIVQGCISKNCQDLSLAGKQKGMKRDTSTRSGLLWEVERLLKELNESATLSLPQILLMENVPQVIGTKNIKDFEEWLQFLRSLGYSNYYNILNAKDFGIPQNRERCFMISILGAYSYEFPKGFPLKLRLKDVLEKQVDERYYLSDSKIKAISNWKAQQDPLKDIDKEKVISPTLTARGAGEEHSGMVLINEETLKEKLCNTLLEKQLVKDGDVISYNYTNNRLETLKKIISNQKYPDCSPVLATTPNCLGVVTKETDKDNTQVDSIPIKDNTKKGYTEAGGGSGNIPKVIKEGNYTPSGHNASVNVNKEGIAPTVMENHDTVTAVVDNYVGLFDYTKSDTFMKGKHREKLDASTLPALTTKGCDSGVMESIWTEQQSQMITEDGNIKRYLNSDVVDKFGENQCADISFPNGYNKGPRVHNECPTLNTTTTESSFIIKESNLHIRKLTPKECWRLMGFDDESFERAKTNLSITFYNGQDKGNSQLYKQAGNSIVVQVLEALFKQLF